LINFAQPTTSMSDRLYMQRCLDLAALSKGFTAPNPMVGAVLVYEGRIIGEGRHEHYGHAHAEVNCFDSVAQEDRPLIPHATMYVSLEPCAHYGKTPPCAGRIIREQVKKVIIANHDPFARVDGKGIAMLQEAGVAVSTGLMEQEGLWLNRRFFTFHSKQRPYIILKWAQSCQGFFAPADKSRKQLSNAWSNRLTHQWRTQEAAILVGTTTALNDNPRLSARLAEGPQPLRIAIDRELRIPASHHLYNDEAASWIVNAQRSEQSGSTRLLQLDFDDSLLHTLCSALYHADKTSLIVEGGAHLLQQFIDLGLWDEARIITAGTDLPAGIPAPQLQHATQVYTTKLNDDRLSLYLNDRNHNSYTPSANL